MVRKLIFAIISLGLYLYWYSETALDGWESASLGLIALFFT